MQNETKKPFAEQLHTQSSAEKPSTNLKNSSDTNAVKNIHLNTWENITGTPFMITGNEEIGFFAVMGRWAITDKFKSPQEVHEYVDGRPWELLLTIMTCVFETIHEQKGK